MQGEGIMLLCCDRELIPHAYARFYLRDYQKSWGRASTWEYTWREEAALASSTSFLSSLTRMKTTGKTPLFFLKIINNSTWSNWFPYASHVLCSQSVRAGRSGCHRGSGQPGVRERIHRGLHPGAHPLHLPSAQESPGRPRLLLWQLFFSQIMSLLPCQCYLIPWCISYKSISNSFQCFFFLIHRVIRNLEKKRGRSDMKHLGCCRTDAAVFT